MEKRGHCIPYAQDIVPAMVKASLWQTSCPIKNSKVKQKRPKKQRTVTVVSAECWHQIKSVDSLRVFNEGLQYLRDQTVDEWLI